MTRDEALAAIRAEVGEAGWIEDEADRDRYERDWRGVRLGRAAAIVRPATPESVARVLALCSSAGLPVVPQGGNTGLVEGGLPRGEGAEIVVSTERLSRIRWIDVENDAIAVDAGVVLQALQEAADEAGRYFPLSLGAEGSCRIGGNLSTNAGGINVLRYGTARAMVLGLEVALADGRLWSDMTAVRKDVTGYDLKQLFIGAEGTLGIITGAVLRLFPRPVRAATAFLAMRDAAAAVTLLPRLRAATGDRISSFELISQRAIDRARRFIDTIRDPLTGPRDWSVLVEITTTTDEADLDDRLEEALAAEMDSGLILDAVVARSEDQRRQLWHLREEVPSGQKLAGGSIRHDVSVPVSRIPDFLDRCEALHAGPFPMTVPVFFGHVGDGNLHANFAPAGDGEAEAAAFRAARRDLTRAVYDIVADLGGSISAEHGIGLHKRDDFLERAQGLELELMRKVKALFDPAGILNPGRIF